MFKINDKFVMKDIDDGILLIDTTAEKNIYHFNDFGKVILNNLSMSKNDFIELILKTYDVKKSIVNKDYKKFIKTLLKSGIIEEYDEKRNN